MNREQATMPWWRVRMMWLVVGGPALVVVAATATMVIAVRGADRPLRDSAVVTPTPNLAPAMKARNHAATASP